MYFSREEFLTRSRRRNADDVQGGGGGGGDPRRRRRRRDAGGPPRFEGIQESRPQPQLHGRRFRLGRRVIVVDFR